MHPEVHSGMHRRRARTIAVGSLALVASALLAVDAPTSATGAAAPAVIAGRATLPPGFRDTTMVGDLSEPVSVAFAPDGTAFIALKTGGIKSFDYDAATGQFEAAATSTDFADLSDEVENYGDRGLTGITVDPQFPARPYVYVNYTLNKDPATGAFPAWGTPGVAYDNCGPNDSNEATLSPPTRGCPVLDRVSRLTAEHTALGWTMAPGSEHVLVEDGCAQFSSHSSGDVVFGPDGLLYASAGDGASFRGADSGQANGPYPEGPACPGDPTNEGGSLRAQDQRTSGDPLGIDGTIFRMDPDAGLNPNQATAGQWLVAMGQRNPWRLTFRQGKEQLWSVDVGSSNWEEINRLGDAPTTSLINRGWPCYEGANGQSVVNPSWTPPADGICPGLYAAGPNAVQPPVFSYRTRTGATPITPGENCPANHSSAMSGIAFTPLGTNWPGDYQDALYFSDFLRGCIWRLVKDANGQPDPTRVQVFGEAVGAPVKLAVGPDRDLYYVDYGSFTNGEYNAGSGGIHRISYAGATRFTLRSSPGKAKIKVDGKRHRTPYRTGFDPGTVVKLVAPKVFVKHGVHYVFKKWKGVHGKKKRKRRLTVTVGTDPISLKAVYRRARPR
jgi:glucose/arabinose dehydrogenase